MERRPQQRANLVLKYVKRRYDGGGEADLIRSIERQNQNDQLNRMYQGAPVPQAAPAASVPVSQEMPGQPEALQAEDLKFSPVTEAILMGPLQLSVGSVGMLTAALAILTFRQAKNEVMVQQAKQVFNDCMITFNKGLRDTLAMPVRLFKASQQEKKKAA